MTPQGAPAVAAKPVNGATTDPETDLESDRLPGGDAALGVSTTGAGPQANINANNAVMINPAVVARISHSLNLGARCTFRMNQSLSLNF